MQIDPNWFRQEIARRGLTGVELERRGILSKPTVARLRAGLPVAASTARKVDAMLRSIDPLAIELIAADPQGKRDPGHD